MFSRIVPPNSHVSCSTMPMFERSSRRRIVGDVDAVERDGAAVELVEPHDQVDQRGLAGAGRPDDGDGLARLGDERQVLDQRVRRGRRRTTTWSNSTRPCGLGVGRAGRVGSAALLVGVEQLEDPLGRGDARLQHVDHRRQLRERLGELARVLDERLDVADGSAARRHPQAADHRDRHVVQVAEEHHRRLDRCRR